MLGIYVYLIYLLYIYYIYIYIRYTDIPTICPSKCGVLNQHPLSQTGWFQYRSRKVHSGDWDVLY